MRIIVFMAVCLLPLIVQAQPLSIQEHESPSGQKFWLLQDDFVPVISLSMGFASGSAFDGVDQQGASLMVASLMSEGAGDLDAQAFHATLNDHAIDMAFSAGRDGFTVSMQTLTHHQDVAIDLLAKALTQAKFDHDDIERIRTTQIARLKNSLKNPDWRASRLLLSRAYGQTHPYARNSGGTLTSLAALTQEQIQERYKMIVNRQHLNIAIAGSLSAQEAGVMVDRILTDVPAHAVDHVDETVFDSAGVSIFHPFSGPQTRLRMVWPAPRIGDDDYAAASLLSYTLGGGFGSRLMEEIREQKGLTYGINAYLMGMQKAGRLVVSTAAQHDNIAQIISSTDTIVAQFMQEGITPQELATAKAYLIGSYPLALTSTARISGHMLSLLASDMPREYPHEWIAALDAVNIEDVNRVAREIFSTQPLRIAVGDVSAPEEWDMIEDLPNVK